LQIWLLPNRRGHTPGYQQRRFDREASRAWQLVASPDGGGGSLQIHQDARLYHARPESAGFVVHDLAPDRAAYLHVATGSIEVNGERLDAGDAVAIEGEPRVEVKGIEAGEILLFDLG
jgi:redox-sensitive bicupin YhaK (pirin superfamily)